MLSADRYISVMRKVKGMITPYDSLSCARGPQVPGSFFGAILSKLLRADVGRVDLKGYSTSCITSLLAKIKPKRELVYDRTAAEWQVTVGRRLVRAMQFAKVLIDDAYVLGYKGFEEEEIVVQVARWLIMDWCGVAIKQVKLHLVWLSGWQRGVKCDTDGMLDIPGMLLTVKHRLWLKKLLSDKNHPISAEVAAETCLLGTKRGFPSEEDDMVDAKKVEYIQQMGTDVPFKEAIIPLPIADQNLTRHVRKAIMRTTDEIFGRTDNVPWEPFSVSQRAGVGAPIYSGGILGWWLRNFPDLLGSEELCRMTYHKGKVWEIRGRMYDTCTLYAKTRRLWTSWTDLAPDPSPREERACTKIRKSFWSEDDKIMYGDALMAECNVYMIREPLKLRTITAGTPSLYGGLGPMLAHLRRGMKQFRIFALTRGVSDHTILAEVMNRNPLGPWSNRLGAEYDCGVHNGKGLTASQPEWDHFISGDFQQSTNDLSMEATDIATGIAFGGTAYQLAHRALGPQVIVATMDGDKNDKIDEKSSEPKYCVQKRGQLMGSPLSFPFLCAINAALMRLAYELVCQRTFALDQLPMLINGDDLLARCSPEIYRVWQACLDVVSWKLSPGKSYFLQNLAQINSETRHVIRTVEHDGRPSAGKPIRYVFSNPIPFLNGGYLHQMKKATNQIDTSTVETMSLDWQDRYRSFERLPPSMAVRAREVMCSNLERLTQELATYGRTPFQLNLHNPVGMGGLGIPLKKEYDFTLVGYGISSCVPRATVCADIKDNKTPPERPLLVWRRGEPPEYKNVLDRLHALCDYTARRFDNTKPISVAACGWESLDSQLVGTMKGTLEEGSVAVESLETLYLKAKRPDLVNPGPEVVIEEPLPKTWINYIDGLTTNW